MHQLRPILILLSYFGSQKHLSSFLRWIKTDIYLILKSGLCVFEAQCLRSVTPCPILSFLGALRYSWVCIRAVIYSPAPNLCSWTTPKRRWMWECESIGKMILGSYLSIFRRDPEFLHWPYWDVHGGGHQPGTCNRARKTSSSKPDIWISWKKYAAD